MIVNSNSSSNEDIQSSNKESQNNSLLYEGSGVRESIERESKFLIEKAQSVMKWVDSTAKYLLPLSFTLFLIIMFATNKNWDDDPNEVWNVFSA